MKTEDCWLPFAFIILCFVAVIHCLSGWIYWPTVNQCEISRRKAQRKWKAESGLARGSWSVGRGPFPWTGKRLVDFHAALKSLRQRIVAAAGRVQLYVQACSPLRVAEVFLGVGERFGRPVSKGPSSAPDGSPDPGQKKR